MQTIEKALHQPMPFTTGGQTISDRLTAAKHSLAGSQLGKTICKATTEELMAPKKKHLDYLLHCTNEPNVSIPSMANLLIERTQHPNWTVVYKSLITIHNIMCYGNERFSQYLASCNTTFNLGSFLDKQSSQGYDMSNHVRRYGKYIGEKIGTYRLCAFDFCKVKRGREDGLLRTMHTDKLLKTLPILQNQIDALLEFQVAASELSNGVINCSFILLFRDLIRLFACYNDGIINLLEKFFDMNKKQCRDALEMYKGFLERLDKVSEFLRVAESVGIDKGEIPDLTRAPASLLEALESHVHHLEGGRGPPPSNQQSQQLHNIHAQMFQQPFPAGGFNAQAHQISDADRQRCLEMEKERMRQIEEQRQKQQHEQASSNTFNPFATNAPPPPTQTQQPKKTSDDLLDLFAAPPQPTGPPPTMDASNPFASFAQPTMGMPGMYSNVNQNEQSVNPFAAMSGVTQPPVSADQWSADFAQAATNQQWAPHTQQQQAPAPPPRPQLPNPMGPATADSSDDESAPKQMVTTALGNPFGAMQSNAHGNASPVPVQTQPMPVGGASQPITIGGSNQLGIYEQTPFSNMDGSYTAQPVFAAHTLINQQSGSPAPGFGTPTQPGGFDPLSSGPPQQKLSGDVDSALSSLADNLSISGQNNQGKPVQWGGVPSQGGMPGRPAPPATTYQSGYAPQNVPPGFGTPSQYGQMGYGVPGGYPQQQMQWGQPQQPNMYAMQPPYGMYPVPPGGFGAPPTQQQAPPTNDNNPFGNPFN